jgi:parvulin-like peptidyl-prolyl isomerase
VSPKRTALALAAAVALAAVAPLPAAVVEEIAAWVNGDIITRSELQQREATMVAQLASRLVGDELDKQLERGRATLLTDMIREEILLQRAEVLGLELDKVFQQSLDQLKEQQGIKTNQEFEELLKEEGISREELRDTLLRVNVPDIMINLEVRDKVVVTDVEIEDYYKKHSDEFRSQEEFMVREIVIVKEKHPGEELEAVGAKVNEALASGTPFEEIVKQYSEAPSKSNDGLIGPLHRGDLLEQIETAALALQPGQASSRISTPHAWHWVKLESLTESKVGDLQAARGAITSRLKKEKFIDQLRKYFVMLMETNRIEVNPVYKDYDQRTMELGT